MRRCAFLLPFLLFAAGCASHTESASYDLMPSAATADVPGLKSFKAKNSVSRVSAGLRRENSADHSTFKAPAGRKMTYSTRLVINVPDTVKGSRHLA